MRPHAVYHLRKGPLLCYFGSRFGRAYPGLVGARAELVIQGTPANSS